MCKLDLGYNKPGLGPNKWGILRHLLPFHVLFHKAAVTHDIEGYSVGGDEEDKNMADWKFYRDMLKECHTDIQALFARIYYEMVHKFGWIFFKYKI